MDGGSKKEVIKNVFRHWDTNGDGFIDEAELRYVLGSLASNKDDTDRLCSHFVEYADTNNDGQVSYDEFVEWAFGGFRAGSVAELVNSFECSLNTKRKQVYNHGVKVSPGFDDEGSADSTRLEAISETVHGGATKPTIFFDGTYRLELRVAKKEGEIRLGLVSASNYMQAVEGGSAGQSFYSEACHKAVLFLCAYSRGGKVYCGKKRVAEVDINIVVGDLLAIEYNEGADMLTFFANGAIVYNCENVTPLLTAGSGATLPMGDLCFGIQFHKVMDAVDFLNAPTSTSGICVYKCLVDLSEMTEHEQKMSVVATAETSKGATSKPTILCDLSKLEIGPHSGSDIVIRWRLHIVKKQAEFRFGLIAARSHVVSSRSFCKEWDRKDSGMLYSRLVCGFPEVAEAAGVPGLSWYTDDCGNGTAHYITMYQKGSSVYRGKCRLTKLPFTVAAGDTITIQLTKKPDVTASNCHAMVGFAIFHNGARILEYVPCVDGSTVAIVDGDKDRFLDQTSIPWDSLSNYCLGVQMYQAEDSIVVEAPVLVWGESASDAGEKIPSIYEMHDSYDLGPEGLSSEPAGPPLIVDAALPSDIELPPAGFLARQVRPERSIQEQDLFDGLARLFTVDKPHHLHKGVDVRGSCPHYDGVRVVRVWQIVSFLNANYSMTRKWMQWKAGNRPDLTMGDQATNLEKYHSGLPLALDKKISEVVLLHGTRPETVLPILANGLNERFSQGMFGNGTYLAENIEKIDQYCTVDRSIDAAGLDQLHGHLYSAASPHPGSVYYSFVCRAILGHAVHSKDGLQSLDGDQVFVRDVSSAVDGRELHAIPGSNPPEHYHALTVELGAKIFRHREFIVFHSDRILPEFLIAYQRTDADTLVEEK